jgi:tagatose-6-phosphate ketose/aldose isomerase
MNALTAILQLPHAEKEERGLLHTPLEIAQQPETWQTTYRLFQEARPDLVSFLKQAHEEKWSIYLIGAGTSDYIGHSIANLMRRAWQTEVSAVASTDLLTNRDDLIIPGKKYLWISFSRSGDSLEGVVVLEQALERNPDQIKHVVVSCNAEGKMAKLARARHCFAMLLDDAVNDRSLAMTSSFTNMVVFGQALAGLWQQNDLEPTLSHMQRAAESILDRGADLAQQLARENYTRACFVGSGSLRATAHESSLKLLELTAGSIQTMHESSLGLRHGPMSSLNMDTLLTSFISSDPNRCRYDIDLLNEVRRKDVTRTVVSVGADDGAHGYSINDPAFGAIDDAYRPAVDVIFSQMLGLFCSIELGLKPDSPSPRGLISRVVEKFVIYA